MIAAPSPPPPPSPASGSASTLPPLPQGRHELRAFLGDPRRRGKQELCQSPLPFVETAAQPAAAAALARKDAIIRVRNAQISALWDELHTRQPWRNALGGDGPPISLTFDDGNSTSSPRPRRRPETRRRNASSPCWESTRASPPAPAATTYAAPGSPTRARGSKPTSATSASSSASSSAAAPGRRPGRGPPPRRGGGVWRRRPPRHGRHLRGPEHEDADDVQRAPGDVGRLVLLQDRRRRRGQRAGARRLPRAARGAGQPVPRLHEVGPGSDRPPLQVVRARALALRRRGHGRGRDQLPAARLGAGLRPRRARREVHRPLRSGAPPVRQRGRRAGRVAAGPGRQARRRAQAVLRLGRALRRADGPLERLPLVLRAPVRGDLLAREAARARSSGPASTTPWRRGPRTWGRA